jgi:putative restriction endonuclease
VRTSSRPRARHGTLLCMSFDVTREFLHELEVRRSAMSYVEALAAHSSDGTVTREELQRFEFGGESVKLLDTSRGIRNPRQLLATLSILTSHDSRYDDKLGADGLLRYAIREGELGQGDNRKLRAAFEMRLPLLWFVGIRSAVFLPIMPVFLMREDAAAKQYVVAIGHEQRLMVQDLREATAPAEREYIVKVTRQRLHQPAFRARVLHAYGTRCAVCSLKNSSLLDAAHILADGHPNGHPETSNGLALCKIHHAAYDHNVLGIGPDRIICVHERVLREVDGPMLKHGIQEFHGQALRVIPSKHDDQPDSDRLAERFEEFRRAG